MQSSDKLSKGSIAMIIFIILAIATIGFLFGEGWGRYRKTKEYETYEALFSYPEDSIVQLTPAEPEPIRIILEVENHSQCHCDETESIIEPQSRYGFTDEEVYLLAQLLCGSYKVDGDGEYDFVWDGATYDEVNFVEVSKVLCVVMNRVNGDGWPDTVEDVVLQSGQFAVMPANLQTTPSELAIDVVSEWCDKYDLWLDDILVVPASHVFFSSGENNTNNTRESW